jgi:hypothetical protein
MGIAVWVTILGIVTHLELRYLSALTVVLEELTGGQFGARSSTRGHKFNSWATAWAPGIVPPSGWLMNLPTAITLQYHSCTPN